MNINLGHVYQFINVYLWDLPKTTSDQFEILYDYNFRFSFYYSLSSIQFVFGFLLRVELFLFNSLAQNSLR